MSLPYSFLIPRRFHIGYALLGRGLRRKLGDRLRAEAWNLIVLTGLGLLLILTQYLSWALFNDIILSNPGGPEALTFWFSQLLGTLGLVIFGMVGWQPVIHVEADATAIRLKQGREMQTLPLPHITDARIISAARYHTHYRRYASTQCYVNRLPASILMLDTPDGPFLLGLAEDDQELLLAHVKVYTLLDATTPRPANQPA